MLWLSMRGIGSQETEHIRVEKTPVPIILLRLRKTTVIQPTEYPNGELISTGAPLASW